MRKYMVARVTVGDLALLAAFVLTTSILAAAKRVGAETRSTSVWLLIASTPSNFEVAEQWTAPSACSCYDQHQHNSMTVSAPVPEIPAVNVDKAAGYYVKTLGFTLDWGTTKAA